MKINESHSYPYTPSPRNFSSSMISPPPPPSPSSLQTNSVIYTVPTTHSSVSNNSSSLRNSPPQTSSQTGPVIHTATSSHSSYSQTYAPSSPTPLPQHSPIYCTTPRDDLQYIQTGSASHLMLNYHNEQPQTTNASNNMTYTRHIPQPPNYQDVSSLFSEFKP